MSAGTDRLRVLLIAEACNPAWTSGISYGPAIVCPQRDRGATLANETVARTAESRIPAELAVLERRAARRRLAADELVLDYEDGSTDVYFIVSGAVRVLIRTPNGKEMLLADLGPGEFIGETTAIDGGARSANVTATMSTELLIIPCAAFLEAACRGNEALRAEVEGLLACDEHTPPRGDLLDTPLVQRTGGCSARFWGIV